MRTALRTRLPLPTLFRPVMRLSVSSLIVVGLAVVGCSAPTQTTQTPDDSEELGRGEDDTAALPSPVDAIDATLSLSASATDVVADGVGGLRVTATLAGELGAAADVPLVVTFRSDLGAFEASTVPLDDEGVASTVWLAPTDAELGAADEATATLSAEVRLLQAVSVASDPITIAVTAPAEGAPVLELSADVVQQSADGATDVVLTAAARRVDAGEALTWSTDLGDLSEASTVLDDQLSSTVTLRSASPGEARVSVAGPDGTFAELTITFLDEDAPQFDLNGTWAQLGYGRVRLSGGALEPDPQCVIAPSVTLMHVVQDGTEVSIASSTCELVMPEVVTTAGLTQTIPGPSFLDAIGDASSIATLDSLQLGATLAGEDAIEVLGADLPAVDAELPSSSADPAVFDEDNDGNPGVTVIVTGTPLGIGDGPQFIINRTRSRMSGTVVSSTLIDGSEPGSLISFSETSVLDSALANGLAPLAEGIPSVFKAVRVDGQFGALDIADRDGDATSISCADVLNARQLLFADLAPPETPRDCSGL